VIEIHGIKGGRPDEHQVDKSVHPLRFRKSVACTDEGARKRGEERKGGAREKGHVPRVPRLRPARHRQCGSRQFNVALRRPVVAPGTVRRLANAGGTGVAILRTRPLVGPRNTVSRLGTYGRDIDGPRQRR